MPQKKTWSAALKFKIAMCAAKNEMTLNAICQHYKVAPSLVQRWKKQLFETGEVVFEKEETKSNNIISKLKGNQDVLFAKIGRLTMERDVLKKSVGNYLMMSEEDC